MRIGTAPLESGHPATTPSFVQFGWARPCLNPRADREFEIPTRIRTDPHGSSHAVVATFDFKVKLESMMMENSLGVNRHKEPKEKNTYCGSGSMPLMNETGVRCGCNGSGDCCSFQDSSAEGRKDNAQALQSDSSESHPKVAFAKSLWNGVLREADPIDSGNSAELRSGNIGGLSRLWVIGSWSAGKTTLANMLGHVLGVEPVHLDDLRFLPGWQLVDPAKVRRQVKHLLEGESWVVDGNYTRVGRDLAKKADLVLWLDMPFLRTWFSLAIRSIRRMMYRNECCGGNIERWREFLLPRHSAILKFPRKYFSARRRIAKSIRLFPHVRIRTRNFTKVVSFLERANLQASAPGTENLGQNKVIRRLRNNTEVSSPCLDIEDLAQVKGHQSEGNGFSDGCYGMLGPQSDAPKKLEGSDV